MAQACHHHGNEWVFTLTRAVFPGLGGVRCGRGTGDAGCDDRLSSHRQQVPAQDARRRRIDRRPRWLELALAQLEVRRRLCLLQRAYRIRGVNSPSEWFVRVCSALRGAVSQSGPGLQADFSLEEATEDQEVRAAVRAIIPSSLLLDAHFCAKVRLHDDVAQTAFPDASGDDREPSGWQEPAQNPRQARRV